MINSPMSPPSLSKKDLKLTTTQTHYATHYHAQLELPDKGRAIKELVVC